MNILPVTRLRRSPFYEATVAEGATGFFPYNRMLIPAGYGDPEAEYWRLIEGVAMWDVAGQRQVQLQGPDAGRLAQMLSCRDLSRIAMGQGKYVALCNHSGQIINDPIVFKLAEDLYWLSIADSDIWTWAGCVTGERGLDVAVSEPDVSPLAIQGPRAEDVVAALFGDWVRELRYFWFRDVTLEGIPLKLARAGWSKQGGFELFLLDGSKGERLWQIVKEAGAPFGIGPGNPNPAERVESGLINFDLDADDATNPFELRMHRFVDVDLDDSVIGAAALKRIKAEGPARHQLGIVLEGGRTPYDVHWRSIAKDGAPVGHLTNRAWSYRLKRMIGYALVSTRVRAGDRVSVADDTGPLEGRLVDLPFDIASLI